MSILQDIDKHITLKNTFKKTKTKKKNPKNPEESKTLISTVLC